MQKNVTGKMMAFLLAALCVSLCVGATVKARTVSSGEGMDAKLASKEYLESSDAVNFFRFLYNESGRNNSELTD